MEGIVKQSNRSLGKKMEWKNKIKLEHQKSLKNLFVGLRSEPFNSWVQSTVSYVASNFRISSLFPE